MNALLSSLQGLGVALVTPFHESGKVDYPSLQRLVNHVVSGRANFIVVLGTTGETPTLSEGEQRGILDFVLEVNKGRIPVVVGIAGNDTATLCRRVREWDMTGISAVLSASPSYNKPSQAGIVKHFEMVADASQRPLILYNVPGRTASNMSAETSLTLAKHENVCGIKEASGDLAQISDILAHRPVDFAVWSGDDALAMPTVAMGAEGVISVLGNGLPQRMSEMVQQAAFGLVHEARLTHQALAPLMDLIFEEGNPTGIKCLLHHLGITEPHVRLPLMSCTPKLRDAVYACLANLKVKTA
jgi:4-hydroxy-tetrahydrodipicolinate synthase